MFLGVKCHAISRSECGKSKQSLNFIESSYDGSQQTHMKHPFHHKADSSDGND
jgi:hypothetical protein